MADIDVKDALHLSDGVHDKEFDLAGPDSGNQWHYVGQIVNGFIWDPIPMLDVKQIVERSRAAFNSGKCASLKARIGYLKNLYQMIVDNEKDFIAAIKADLNKPKTETYGFELQLALNDIITCINHLAEWMKPCRVKKPLMMLPHDCYIRYEPLGVVLIIGAWNYPFQLTIHPLIGAIAAGNCAIIKPSEVAEETSRVITKHLTNYLDNDCFQVVNGGIPETTELLKQRFDHILYTGNSVVGKVVMAAAAKHLTPVTLELGGKCPAYVDKNCDITVAARRITWGKFINSGQTCIAPDYIICEEEIRDQLVDEIKATIKEFYGENPQQSADYGRIINERHLKRLESLLDGAHVVEGGNIVAEDRYFAPTVITDVKPEDQIMAHEVFGPILPIMTVENIDDAIRYINSREKPLALYVFTDDKNVREKMLVDTSSGGFLANDVLLHAAVEELPFGGVGMSGTGAYHGKHTFETFSHRRSCMVAARGLEKFNQLRYPPYSAKKSACVKWLLAKTPKREGIMGYWPLTIITMILAAFWAVFQMMVAMPALQ